MTLDQFKEVAEFMQKHHAFAHWLSTEEQAERKNQFPNMKQIGFGIKYLDMCYDSRCHDVWMIKFRQGVDGVAFATNHFAGREMPKGWKYDNLFDLSMAYLKGEFIPKEEFYFDERKS